MMFKRIMVGIDGSKRADKAFDVAVDLTKALDSQLFVVWVVNRDRGMDASFGVSEDFYQDQARQNKEKIKAYVKRAQDKGIPVDANVEIGSIKTVLSKDFPREHDIDLIVVGSTGINAVEKMLQGSHTDYVVRHAAADVLVVK